LSCDDAVDISQLRFSAAQISFSDDRPDTVLKTEESSSGETDPFIDLGLLHEDEVVGSPGALAWSPGKRVILHGQLQSHQEGEVKVSLHLGPV
jgi:hypothetical protein